MNITNIPPVDELVTAIRTTLPLDTLLSSVTLSATMTDTAGDTTPSTITVSLDTVLTLIQVVCRSSKDKKEQPETSGETSGSCWISSGNSSFAPFTK